MALLSAGLVNFNPGNSLQATSRTPRGAQPAQIPATQVQPQGAAAAPTAEEVIAAKLASVEAGWRARPDQVQLMEASRLLLKAGQRRDAIALLEAHLHRYPNFSPLKMQLAQLLIQDGQAARAHQIVLGHARHRTGFTSDAQEAAAVALLNEQEANEDPGTRETLGHDQLLEKHVYLSSWIAMSKTDQWMLNNIWPVLANNRFDSTPAAILDWNKAIVAQQAMVQHGLGRAEEATRLLATIDPPDDNTVAALLCMDKVDEAFDVLPRLTPVALERVWMNPWVDKLIEHPRNHAFLGRSGVESLRLQGVQVPPALLVPLAARSFAERPVVRELTVALAALTTAPSPEAGAAAAARIAALTGDVKQLVVDIAAHVQPLQGQATEDQRRCKIEGVHPARFASEALTEAEQILRWAIATIPTAQAAELLTSLLSIVLIQAGRYEAALALTRSGPLKGENVSIRFIAKAALARTPQSMRDLQAEIDDAMRTHPDCVVAGNIRDTLTATRAVLGFWLTRDDSGMLEALQPIAGSLFCSTLLFMSSIRTLTEQTAAPTSVPDLTIHIDASSISR